MQHSDSARPTFCVGRLSVAEKATPVVDMWACCFHSHNHYALKC